MLSALVVDDSSTIRKMLSMMLSDMNFDVVATASSGEEGIKLYEEHKPNFVTMDVNMPGINGMETLKRIRDNHKDANILMVTSRGDDLLVKESIKYGAKGYILKPLNLEKIKKSLQSVFPNEFKSEDDTQESIEDYDSSIKDTLTGLYSVQYMHHTIQHLLEIHDRVVAFPVGIIILNINNLDDISNEFGSIQKDIILTQAADMIQKTIRPTDFPIKLTNNEFAIFILGPATKDLSIVSEKLIKSIHAIKNEVAIGDKKLEISIGMALHKQDEKLIAFLERTDKAVIEAKNVDSKIHMSK